MNDQACDHGVVTECRLCGFTGFSNQVKQLQKEIETCEMAVADQSRIIKKQSKQIDAYRKTLKELAETGGWVTVWITDPADGQRGPSTSNNTKAIAEDALKSIPNLEEKTP